MFLVLRGCDSYELVRSIVYNVCKVCDCTGSWRHGAKVYVFIIYDWIKLILLVFTIQIPNCQKYFLSSTVMFTQNDLQFVSINSTMYFKLSTVFVIHCFDMSERCVKLWNFFFMKFFILKAIYFFSAEKLLIYSITKFLLKLQTFIHVYAMLTLAYWGKSCSLLVQSSLSI